MELRLIPENQCSDKKTSHLVSMESSRFISIVRKGCLLYYIAVLENNPKDVDQCPNNIDLGV